MYGNDTPVGVVKECKRDLEGDAKRLREAIRNFTAFRDAIKDFTKTNEFYYIDNLDDRKVLLAIFGDLTLKTAQMENEFNILLKKIENEN